MTERDERPESEASAPASDAPMGLHARPEEDDSFHSLRAGASFRRRRLLPTRRAVIAIFLIVLFLAGLLIDGRQSKTQPAAPPSLAVGGSPASATSSAWYCPMTIATPSNPQAGAVIILNPNNATLTGKATYFPQGGPPVEVPVNVPARERLSLHPGDSVDAPFAATLLQFDGGGAAVEHSVASPHGVAYAPCSTQASAQWYFADGSTQADTSLQIGMFNPFLEDAIADVSFVTNDGNVAPDEFQGVVIPARSFTSLSVGDRVRRRDWIATTISVRSGRLVASEFQQGLFNGVNGTGLTLGAVGPAPLWFLPDGINRPGFADQISFYNPSDKESEATVELLTDTGNINPFQLHIPASGRIALNLDKEDRVPKDAMYGIAVRVTNGVNVVVQRTGTVVPPAATTGASFQVADTNPSNRWIVAFNETRDPFDDWVNIMNPGRGTATVKVTSVSPSGQPLTSTGTVQAGRRLLVHVDEFATDGSNPGLIIESDQPVVAGRTLTVVGGTGYSSSLVTSVR